MTRKQRREDGEARCGIVAPLVGLCLIVIIAIASFAIDCGVLQAERRHSQAAADASAMAAACVLYQNYPTFQGAGPVGPAQQAAWDVARANGYDRTSPACQVVVNIPPHSGLYAGKKGYAEVIVSFNQSRTFS